MSTRNFKKRWRKAFEQVQLYSYSRTLAVCFGDKIENYKYLVLWHHESFFFYLSVPPYGDLARLSLKRGLTLIFS